MPEVQTKENWLRERFPETPDEEFEEILKLIDDRAALNARLKERTDELSRREREVKDKKQRDLNRRMNALRDDVCKKRYLVFAGNGRRDHPRGGAWDIVGSGATQVYAVDVANEVKGRALNHGGDWDDVFASADADAWAHVFDTGTGKVVYEA